MTERGCVEAAEGRLPLSGLGRARGDDTSEEEEQSADDETDRRES